MLRKNEESIKNVITRWIDEKKLKSGLQKVQAAEAWKLAMGENVAKYTGSIKLERGVLSVNIISAPLRQELSYGKAQILRLMNEEMGEGTVKEVQLF